eukprot:scaffold115_cov241-Pinguiococcus_pyrenoidosus.AAC.1
MSLTSSPHSEAVRSLSHLLENPADHALLRAHAVHVLVELHQPGLAVVVHHDHRFDHVRADDFRAERPSPEARRSRGDRDGRILSGRTEGAAAGQTDPGDWRTGELENTVFTLVDMELRVLPLGSSVPRLFKSLRESLSRECCRLFSLRRLVFPRRLSRHFQHCRALGRLPGGYGMRRSIRIVTRYMRNFLWYKSKKIDVKSKVNKESKENKESNNNNNNNNHNNNHNKHNNNHNNHNNDDDDENEKAAILIGPS